MNKTRYIANLTGWRQVACVATLLLTCCSPVNGQLAATTNSDGLSVADGDKPVFQFQLTTKSQDGRWPRNNYIHPLHDLDGNVITEDFPKDHGHHRGIFCAWHQVWVGDTRLGDPWVCKNFIWNEVARGTGTLPDGRVTVSSTVEWASLDFRDDSGRMTPVASEHWSVTVYPATDRHRLIDFEIQLRALVPDLHIGGSEDVKGYGGFSPRIRLNSDQTFETESGVVEPLKTAIADGPWVNIQDGRTGFAILQSAANPNFPQPWILRKNRSMQNAVYPGADPVPLSQTSPTILRYRLVIHRGKFMAEEIRTLQTEFDSKTR